MDDYSSIPMNQIIPCRTDYPFHRVLRSPLSDEQLRPLDPRCEVVQFCDPFSEAEFERIGRFMRDYPRVALRIFSTQANDLRFLRFFPFLQSFEIAVFDLQSLEGIECLPPSLQYLGMSHMRKNSFSLRFLRRFHSLKELSLQGQTKDIETIGDLHSLERLTLRSITLKDLSILKSLHCLYWLAIKLGGTTNLDLLPGIGRLRYLELWMIRGLSDVGVIGQLTTLQYLFLQAVKRVTVLPSMKGLHTLRRVHLETMKGITDLGPVADAPNLEELTTLDMPQLQPEAFQRFVGHRQLKRAWVALGSQRKNTAVSALLGRPSSGYIKTDFQFRDIDNPIFGEDKLFSPT